jgi:hypothetical protein
MIVQEVLQQATGLLADAECLRRGRGDGASSDCAAVYKLTSVVCQQVLSTCHTQLWGSHAAAAVGGVEGEEDAAALPLPTRSRVHKAPGELPSPPPPPSAPVPLPLPPHTSPIYAKLFDCLVLCRHICRNVARRVENYFTTFDERIYGVELLSLARHTLALLQVPPLLDGQGNPHFIFF